MHSCNQLGFSSSYFYRLQRSCGQGNIFTPVCHSFCSQGGRGSASVHAGIPHPPPPRSRHPSPGTRHPRSRHPPRTRHPLEQTPTREHTPPPWEQTPPDQTPPPPGSRLRHTVYKRPVRILLECILV